MMLFLANFFVISPLIALLLLFWNKTDFVLVYGKLFGLKKLLKIDKYEEKKRFNLELKYVIFLATTYKNFFIKLITCEICLSTWLSILFCSVLSIINSDFIFLLYIPLNIITGLYLYLTIKKNI